MADVEIAVTYDSLDFIVSAGSGVPSFAKGKPFEVEVNKWHWNSKIREIELMGFKTFEFDPFAKTWVENSYTSPAWSSLSMVFDKNLTPTTYVVAPAYPGGGAHNLVKFTIKLTFKNGKTFKVDPILDERPT
jgi:hypothetical protein